MATFASKIYKLWTRGKQKRAIKASARHFGKNTLAERLDDHDLILRQDLLEYLREQYTSNIRYGMYQGLNYGTGSDQFFRIAAPYYHRAQLIEQQSAYVYDISKGYEHAQPARLVQMLRVVEYPFHPIM